MEALGMGEVALDLLASRFRALSEPLRLRILQELEARELSVGELVEVVQAGQPNVSRHLAILHHAGLVSRRREGTSVFYGIGDPIVFKLCALVCRREEKRNEQAQAALRRARRHPAK